MSMPELSNVIRQDVTAFARVLERLKSLPEERVQADVGKAVVTLMEPCWLRARYLATWANGLD